MNKQQVSLFPAISPMTQEARLIFIWNPLLASCTFEQRVSDNLAPSVLWPYRLPTRAPVSNSSFWSWLSGLTLDMRNMAETLWPKAGLHCDAKPCFYSR